MGVVDSQLSVKILAISQLSVNLHQGPLTNLVPRAISAFKMAGRCDFVATRHLESGDGPGNEVAAFLPIGVGVPICQDITCK